MLDLINPMGAVVVSWLAFFVLFSGLGMTVFRAFGQQLTSGWHVLDSFWLGWVMSIAVLQVWHFAFPVDDSILLIFALVAVVMLFSYRDSLGRILARLRQQYAFMLVFGLLLLWLANRALGSPIAFDSGLRDIQAVMWIDSYAVVPGLGNLFSSLAYNHSVYLYDALLDTAIWSGQSYRIATGLLIMVYLAYASKCALSLYHCRREQDLRWSWIPALASIPFILYYTVNWGGITHFLTDTVVDILGFLTLVFVLDFLQDLKAEAGASQYQIFRIGILVLAGMTVKQSYIVYGLAMASMALLVWIRRGGLALGFHYFSSVALRLGLIGLFLLVPWMARGAVTSGYIAYPVSVGGIEVDWALPHEQIQQRQRALATNTRQRGADPDEVFKAQAWLGPWLQKLAGNIFSAVMPSAIILAALGIYVIGRLRHRGQLRRQVLGLWVLSPMLAMFIFWFVSFPELKYVRYLFWSLAAVTVLLALLAWPSTSLRLRLALVYALAAICMAYVVGLILRQGTGPLAAGPDRGFHVHWQTAYDSFETDHGLILNVPPAGTDQCWHTPLPCTPHPVAFLRERVPGELRHGFRYEAPASLSAVHE